MSTSSNPHELITEEFVQDALLKHKGKDAKFLNFEIVDFCSKGDNYASFVTSVKVRFLLGGSEESVSYVAKVNFRHNMEALRALSEIEFEREGNFYLKLLPELNSVMEKLNLSSLKFAPCYFAFLESNRQIILLGDKRTDGFLMPSRFDGINEDQVTMVVSELARLHAASVVLADNLKGSEEMKVKYPFLKETFDGDDKDLVSSIFSSWLAGNMNIAAKIADQIPGYDKMSSWLKEHAPLSFDMFAAVIHDCDPKFRVIVHGDCWINNLLFRYDGSKVADVCFLDLQGVRRASLALDLNYLLFTSLNGDTRKNGLQSYLAAYYNSFKEVFDAAQKPMKFTREELYAEYRNKNLFGLFTTVMVMPVMVMNSVDVPDASEIREENLQEEMEKQQQKILDMVDTSQVLRPRMLDMFDEMIEHGIVRVD